MMQAPDPQGWLQEHGDYLYGFAMARLHDPELAADLLQETLLAAWKGRDRFQGSSSVRTWLTGILKHKITDHIRAEIRKRNLASTVESDPTSDYFDATGHWNDAPLAWKENPEELLVNEEFRHVFDDCMQKLPEKQRQVFRMRELAGEDAKTICKACDITTTNFHVIMHRARLALRKCLEFNWFGRERRS